MNDAPADESSASPQALCSTRPKSEGITPPKTRASDTGWSMAYWKKSLHARAVVSIHSRSTTFRGGRAPCAAIEEALRVLDGQNEISREQLLAEIERRLK